LIHADWELIMGAEWMDCDIHRMLFQWALTPW
jgi:hypothetical protein